MDFLQRTEMLLGAEALRKLSSARVAIFGLGGVGGGALEALARMGIGEFHLIDPDDFNESNLNRQILSTRSALGKKKVDVAKERVLSINPEAKVFTYPCFFLPEDTTIDFSQFDFVIDAIDTVKAKVGIIARCKELGIPMVSCMGCGNRLDPSKLRVTDLFKTENDPLAKVMRKKCRELGVKHLPVVYSIEEPLTPRFKVESDSPVRRDVPGSCALVPPVAGYLLAHYAVTQIIGFGK